MTIIRRYELTDHDWTLIEPLLPKQRRGGKWNDHRTVLNGIFWVLRSGSAWRDMPERYGKWQTIYDRFVHWRRDGTFGRIAQALRGRLDGEGRIEWDLVCVDGTNVRAMKAAAGAGKTRAPTSRKTTPSGVPAAAGDPRSTSPSTPPASRSTRSSPLAKRTRAPRSSD